MPKDQWSTWEEHLEKVTFSPFKNRVISRSQKVKPSDSQDILIQLKNIFQGFYLKPYIDEIVREMEEKEAWDKN